MYILLFLYLEDQIFDITKIDQIVSTKLLIDEDNPIGELFSIISSVMFYNSCENHNLNMSYISRSENILP